MRSFIPRIPFIIASFLLIGCAVGPDFTKPDMAVPGRYTEAPLPSQTVAADSKAGEAQFFTFTNYLPGEWWKLFG
jgi:hypothetical protein